MLMKTLNHLKTQGSFTSRKDILNSVVISYKKTNNNKTCASRGLKRLAKGACHTRTVSYTAPKNSIRRLSYREVNVSRTGTIQQYCIAGARVRTKASYRRALSILAQEFGYVMPLPLRL